MISIFGVGISAVLLSKCIKMVASDVDRKWTQYNQRKKYS